MAKKVEYTQRELDLIEEAKKNIARKNGASKPVFDESGAQIGIEGQASAPKPTVVGDTLYGSGRSPSPTAAPAAAMPAGMETRKLPGGGTVTASPSVLDAPSTLPDEYRVHRSAAPKTVAESVSVLQREWNKFNNETAAKAASFVPDGLLRTEAGADIRPLADFKAESDWNRAEDRRAQGELSQERRDSGMRRSNLAAIQRRIRGVAPMEADKLEAAQAYMDQSRSALSGNTADENLDKFRNRNNPYARVSRRSRTTNTPTASAVKYASGAV